MLTAEIPQLSEKRFIAEADTNSDADTNRNADPNSDADPFPRDNNSSAGLCLWEQPATEWGISVNFCGRQCSANHDN